MGYKEFMSSAVKSYIKRTMPRLILTDLQEFNCSLEAFVQFLLSACTFVSDLIKNSIPKSHVTCPFQFDVLIAMGQPIKTEVDVNPPDYINDDAKNDDDDDDDDDEQEPEPYRDFIGNVEDKLKENKLKYCKNACDSKDLKKKNRIFDSLYREFDLEFGQKQNGDDQQMKTGYIHSKRMVSVVDMRPSDSVYVKEWDTKQNAPSPKGRKMGAKDTVYLYEPPSDVLTIPTDAVPELFHLNSKLCILPDMKYTERMGTEMKEGMEEDSAKNKSFEHSAKYENIGSLDSANGSVAIFSFHVMEERKMKLYMCCNGQCMRFMPEDIITVLPRLFNMDYLGNREYLKTDEIKGAVSSMRDMLIDEEFTSFQQRNQSWNPMYSRSFSSHVMVK